MVRTSSPEPRDPTQTDHSLYQKIEKWFHSGTHIDSGSKFLGSLPVTQITRPSIPSPRSPPALHPSQIPEGTVYPLTELVTPSDFLLSGVYIGSGLRILDSYDGINHSPRNSYTNSQSSTPSIGPNTHTGIHGNVHRTIPSPTRSIKCVSSPPLYWSLRLCSHYTGARSPTTVGGLRRFLLRSFPGEDLGISLIPRRLWK